MSSAGMTSAGTRPWDRDFREPNKENPLRNSGFWHFIAGKNMEKHHFCSRLSLHHRLSEMLKASCDLAFGAAEFGVKLHLGAP